MSGFYVSFVQSPMFFIGLFFAIPAAIAFLVFIRGGLSGLPGLFTMSADVEYQELHRIRVTWGLLMLIFLFIYWELLKATISFFGSGAENFWTFVLLAVLWFLLVVAPFLLPASKEH